MVSSFEEGENWPYFPLPHVRKKSGVFFFHVIPFVACLFPGQTNLDYFKQVHTESLGNWQKDKRKIKIIRELKSGERSNFGSSPCAWRHFGYISTQTQTHINVSDLLRWDVSSRSKQETSERFAIKKTSIGKNVTRTLVKKKSKQNETHCLKHLSQRTGPGRLVLKRLPQN